MTAIKKRSRYFWLAQLVLVNFIFLLIGVIVFQDFFASASPVAVLIVVFAATVLPVSVSLSFLLKADKEDNPGESGV